MDSMMLMMMMTIMDGGDNDMRMIIPMVMMMNNRGSSGGTGPDMMMPMMMMMMIAGRKKPKREREKEGESHWSYDGNSGPAYWGDLFPRCNGLSQSPIDISGNNVSPISEPSPLTFSITMRGIKI